MNALRIGLRRWFTSSRRASAVAAESAPVTPPPARSQPIAHGNFTHYAGSMPAVALERQSPIRPLYTEAEIGMIVLELRTILARDDSSECQTALKSPFAEKLRGWGRWYQRIEFPQHGLSSTSDHTAIYSGEGSYNRLNQRLSSAEACILRPWPKWCYLRRLLPPVAGKTVLEVGSANGFFSFRFAELGARQVTGIEAVKILCEQARWAAGVLGAKNVSFQNTDFLLDLTIQPHDVVFLSEVHNHFLFPFFGLLRLINLARETVVLETIGESTAEHGLTLNSGWRNETGALLYHSFHLTDGLLMDFLSLVGVPAECVVRYKAPDDPSHVVYVIDTRQVPQIRRQRDYPEYLRATLDLNFTCPPAGPNPAAANTGSGPG